MLKLEFYISSTDAICLLWKSFELTGQQQDSVLVQEVVSQQEVSSLLSSS